MCKHPTKISHEETEKASYTQGDNLGEETQTLCKSQDEHAYNYIDKDDQKNPSQRIHC